MIKYKVVSDSMEPLISVGAELLLDERKSIISTLKRFDIVVFQEKDILMCHYIWHINKTLDKGNITTRSLKTGEEDVTFSFKKIQGKVLNYKIGNLLKFKLLIGIG